MNLPVGQILQGAVELPKANLKAELVKMYEAQLSGYVALTIEGVAGIEEGILLFRYGVPIGCFYHYMKFNSEIFGNSAIKHFFNAATAKYGVYDIVSLTAQQAELVTAFNVKARINSFRKAEIESLWPKQFSASLAEEVLAAQNPKEQTKYDIFKKLGLTKIHS